MAVFESIVALLRENESFVLATILSCCGSAPRDAGSRMLIQSDGSIIGSVGGGILEAKIQELAGELSQSKRTLIGKFSLNPEGPTPIGMICGGDVEFLLHFEDASQPGRLELYEGLVATLASKRRAWLTIQLPDQDESEGPPVVRVFKEGGASLDAQGSLRLRELLVEASSTQPSVVTCEGKRFFIEPLSSEGTVYIFGAGHIGQKLAPLTKFVGFQTVVLDDREQFANREFFDSADRIVVLDSFDDAMNDLAIDEESYLVIVTRGHAHDKTVLEKALKTPAGYVGMIGSRKKRDATYEVLAGEGFTAQDFLRVHSPIGLDMGAETPDEIAVSIVAELIQTRAKRSR
jgi:xanthine dehydrogenase accessory factor